MDIGETGYRLLMGTLLSILFAFIAAIPVGIIWSVGRDWANYPTWEAITIVVISDMVLIAWVSGGAMIAWGALSKKTR